MKARYIISENGVPFTSVIAIHPLSAIRKAHLSYVIGRSIDDIRADYGVNGVEIGEVTAVWTATNILVPADCETCEVFLVEADD